MENNMALTTNFSLVVLNEFKQSALVDYSDSLTNAIAELNQLIRQAIESEHYEKIAEYKSYIKFATANKNKINACLINKEADIKSEGEFATIFFN